MKTKSLKSTESVARLPKSHRETAADAILPVDSKSATGSGDPPRKAGHGKRSKRRAKNTSSARANQLKVALAEVRRLLDERGIQSAGGDDPNFATNTITAYHEIIARIREIVRTKLPANSPVAVVNKGDVELLKLDGRPAMHFPCNADGSYSGHYPATAADAIAQLEAVHADGAQHLIFPATALWWLDFYGDFRTYLDTHYRRIVSEDGVCVIYGLDERRSAPCDAPGTRDGENGAAAEAEPEDEISVRIELAKSLKALGRTKQAQHILAEGIDAEPGSARLHIALMQLAVSQGDKAGAMQHEAAALALAPDDYAVNLAIGKAAWQQRRNSVAEQRLVHLVALFPSDPVALNELMNLHCSRVESKHKDAAMMERFLSLLSDADSRRHITPVTHLRICEALGAANETEAALACLDAALRQLNSSSEPFRGFLTRLVRSIVSESSAIPFSDPASLAAFLTHAGNGFAAVADRFRAEACWRLATVAQIGSRHAGWAARFNLAFAAMARGDAGAAMHSLAGATRLYPDETARILWPREDGAPWPRAKFDLSTAFGAMKPADFTWPKITVITPSFNQAAYIEETLLSVLHQNYPALEYIVVDGASTDGSVEILRRYESRVAKLIVEKDHGQTEAINKGLRLATGDIILWINSDDLLCPGALFMIALAWLEDGADIIAGFCCEHTERRFGLINLPAVTQATFNAECLGDLFHYWLKGHYFYQPEVAFSRRILEKVGGSLDERLYYTMDYEFWLRCAVAGARLTTVRWPVGFFRKHNQQKTANADRTVIEQATVRDRFVIPRPRAERRLEIRRRLQRVFENPMPKVTVVSSRAPKIFATNTGAQLRKTFAAEGLNVTFGECLSNAQPGDGELVILLIHLHKEHETLRKLREGGFDGPIAGWFWDNHHHVFDNYSIGKDLDVSIASHGFAQSYLRSPHQILAEPAPLCVTQWTDAESVEFFARHGMKKRSDSLYGGFVRYGIAEKRNRLIESLIAAGSDDIYFLEEDKLAPYFGMSPEERFADWTARKVSLCLPLADDLSQRLFDALLSGQIPIVPNDMHDLDGVIPSKLQHELPIVRFSRYTADAVNTAHSKALEAFARGGIVGIRRRHRFAMDHTFVPRIRTIVSALRGMAAGH